ncbi:MAG: penicillin-binding protein 1C [Muribaculaceae bacterium]|nr:penicillin-binding protein 1C [Muribaculaceae bacterium]
MKHSPRRYRWWAIAVAASCVLLWLFCLPGTLFGDVAYSTVVTAADGTLLGARVAADGQWRFPPSDTVPEKFAKALIEYEDRTFYSHFGVSLRGICRAMKQNLSNGRVVSGASTITMQTIRLHRRGPRDVLEKVVEMFMATRLELRCSKAEILKLYASHAPFGGNVVGIDAAVWRYLGNDGNDMSWAEATTLAVLQNAPSTTHLSKNRGKLLAKRNRLLKRLYDKGEISDEEYQLSIEEPLIGTPVAMPSVAQHLVEYYHKKRRGQRTRTDIDHTLQKRVEDMAASWRSELAMTGAHDLAIVVAEVTSGKIIAYCGNADMEAERHGRWVDIARSPRSSGSILKPLLYCASLQEGVILEKTILPDVPTDFGGFAPKNFDGSYAGIVPADEALSLSLNIPNVYLLKQFGTARFASLLHKCGLASLTRPAHEYGLSLVLGGAEVTLFDIVNCYTKLARFEPDFPLNDSTAIYSMLNAMREVNRPDGLDYSRVSDLQNIAWKTGTSYGARDAWAIGITPGYVVGVWVGNADGTGVADMTGARAAGPLMLDVFNLLPWSGWFPAPKGFRAKVCRNSGHLAGKYCKDTVWQTVPRKGRSTGQCPYCREIPVSADGQRIVSDCAEPVVMKSYFMLPPLQKYFYKLRHADFVDAPVDAAAPDIIKFIYPADGSCISLPPSPDNVLTCKAAHSEPSATLFWHLDNNFVGATTDLHQININPGPGVHRLTAIDHYGSSASLEFVVK